MKNPLLIILLVAAVHMAYAQHVGIGVDTPDAMLHIFDTSQTAATLKLSSDGATSMEMHTTGTNTKSINFFENGDLKASLGMYNSGLSIYTNYVPVIPYVALRITNSNRVGLNFSPLATPSQTLDVNGKIKLGDDILTPTAGTMRYNSGVKLLQVHDGTSWLNASTPWADVGTTLHYDQGPVLIGRSNTIGAERFGVRYNTSGSGYGGMYMETNGGPSTRPFYGYAIDGAGKMWHYYDGADSHWKLYNNGIRVSVGNTGLVGIGVQSPDARLDVLGGSWDPASSEGDLRIGSPSYRLVAGVATDGLGAGAARIYSKGGAAKLILGSDDTDVLTIDSDNDVGIGTTSPESDLHIYKTSGTTDLRLETDNGNSILRLDASSGNTGYSQVRFTENNGLSAAMWYNYSTDALELYESGTAMTIQNARVGIGTLPNVNYKLSVNGSVICEEIKVQLSENWPDYVFDKDYHLKSIPELKSFIDQHGHLPGVPSSEEVASNSGFELGEMNRILLEKVEELTLMLIRQQEEIDELKAGLNK